MNEREEREERVAELSAQSPRELAEQIVAWEQYQEEVTDALGEHRLSRPGADGAAEHVGHAEAIRELRQSRDALLAAAEADRTERPPWSRRMLDAVTFARAVIGKAER